MRQGTTPEFVFELPFSTDIVKNAKVTFVSYGGAKIQKRLADCVFDGNKITVKLSQSETFKFNCTKPIEIQLRILTKTDEAFSSDTFCVEIDKCLDDEVLS